MSYSLEALCVEQNKNCPKKLTIWVYEKQKRDGSSPYLREPVEAKWPAMARGQEMFIWRRWALAVLQPVLIWWVVSAGGIDHRNMEGRVKGL